MKPKFSLWVGQAECRAETGRWGPARDGSALLRNQRKPWATLTWQLNVKRPERAPGAAQIRDWSRPTCEQGQIQEPVQRVDLDSFGEGTVATSMEPTWSGQGLQVRRDTRLEEVSSPVNPQERTCFSSPT